MFELRMGTQSPLCFASKAEGQRLTGSISFA